MKDTLSSLPFDLRALEIFLAVCETGTMAAAAVKLAMTQPAVSLSIAELERKSSAILFDRSVRPVALTPAGGLLRLRASALIAEARQIGPLLRDTKGSKIPLIRVGLVDSLSRALTAPLAKYLATRANEVSILSGLTATHASELLTRRLDLFLGVDDLEELPGLERWELAREPYVLLLPRKAPDIRTVQAMTTLTRSLPLIRFSARSQTGVEVERHIRRLGLNIARSFEFDSPVGVTALVAAGEGFAITTPLCVYETALIDKRIKQQRLPGPQITRKLTLVARYRELGNIPREAADTSRTALAKAELADLKIAT